jgi:hypothetical protein
MDDTAAKTTPGDGTIAVAMKPRRLRRGVTITSALLALCVGLPMAVSRLGDDPAPPEQFRISRADAARPAGSVAPVPDGLRQMYPDPRGWFHLESRRGASIAVLATGVQILTDSGWETQPTSLDHRGEIWRLRSGIPREFCVEHPHWGRWGGTWRAYVRYAGEMKGPRLWYWQLRGAWADRSFTNWTGKAWGGGRFAGDHQLVSETIDDPTE